MQFEAFRIRIDGRLVPRYRRWAGGVRGELMVAEQHDHELGRSVRVARLVQGGAEQLPPLYDVVLIGAKPDLWTLTGWERTGGLPAGPEGCAYQ